VSPGDGYRLAGSLAHQRGQQIGPVVRHSRGLCRAELRVLEWRDGGGNQSPSGNVADVMPVTGAQPVAIQLTVVAGPAAVTAVDIGARRRGGHRDRTHATAAHTEDVQGQASERRKGVGRGNEQAVAHGALIVA
jgi:hypothetical protein